MQECFRDSPPSGYSAQHAQPLGTGVPRKWGTLLSRTGEAQGARRGASASSQGTGRCEDGARHIKKSLGHFLKTVPMKYRFMRAHQGLYPVGKMCRALKVGRGGYYAWLKRPLSKRAKENRMLAAQIERIYRKSHGRDRSSRITHELSGMGHRVSRPRVA